MPQADPAKDIKTALAAAWDTEHPDWTVTLEVADDYQPVAGSPTLLVADDGGGSVHADPWLSRNRSDLLRITVRLTAFARGRTEARTVVDTAVDDLLADRPAGIARIENVPAVLETRDRETGAYLASITVPVTVRPLTA
jgi:hypothetical protein